MPTCRTCRGRGTIRTYPAFGGPSHFADCSACDGKGYQGTADHIPASDNDSWGCAWGFLAVGAGALAGLVALAQGVAHTLT